MGLDLLCCLGLLCPKVDNGECDRKNFRKKDVPADLPKTESSTISHHFFSFSLTGFLAGYQVHAGNHSPNAQKQGTECHYNTE